MIFHVIAGDRCRRHSRLHANAVLKSEDLDTGQVPISWVDLRPTGTAAVPVFADENNITVAISYPQAEEVIAYMHQLYTDYKKHRITEVIADRIVVKPYSVYFSARRRHKKIAGIHP